MRKMPTVKDVAVRAGVSVGTVSRVLSDEVAVKPILRERVNQAIQSLGYRPNVTARALRTRTTDVIGLIVPDITNPFFAQLAASVERAAGDGKHTVMLATSHEDPKAENNHIQAFLDRSVRGIIIVASKGNSNMRIDAHIPVISLDRRLGKFPLVSVDHMHAAALVADHLYELGHRKIAYVAGPRETTAGRMRQEGFINRINELNAGGDAMETEVVPGRFDYESGEQAARALLERAPDKRPTAIAAASDQQAIGALRVARDFKVDVPGELSVTGFDDISLANLVVPRLTTVRQPTDELAKRAVTRLLNPTLPSSDETVECTLVVRGSTGPARPT